MNVRCFCSLQYNKQFTIAQQMKPYKSAWYMSSPTMCVLSEWCVTCCVVKVVVETLEPCRIGYEIVAVHAQFWLQKFCASYFLCFCIGVEKSSCKYVWVWLASNRNYVVYFLNGVCQRQCSWLRPNIEMFDENNFLKCLCVATVSRTGEQLINSIDPYEL